MRIVLALVLVLLGTAGGLGLGALLRPPPEVRGPAPAPDTAPETVPEAVPDTVADTAPGSAGPGGAPGAGRAAADASHGAAEAGDGAAGHAGGPAATGDDPAGQGRSYVKFTRELIVPVVAGGQTRALMLFDIALDVPSELTQRAYAAEPRLLDAFLGELFAMSSSGAFASDYTGERVVAELRGRLRDAARRSLGDRTVEVLIFDIMRQEL